MRLLHRRPAGLDRLTAAMTAPVTVEAEGTCRFCDRDIRKYLGLWTDPDWNTTCLSRPEDGGFDHDPATSKEQDQ